MPIRLKCTLFILFGILLLNMNAISVYAQNNETGYDRNSGYWYIHVYQTSSNGRNWVASYTVNSSLGDNRGTWDGSIWVPSSYVLTAGTPCLELVGTPWSISDGADTTFPDRFNAWDRQYVFCYDTNVSFDGFRFASASAGEGSHQMMIQWPGYADVRLLLDTNEMGITDNLGPNRHMAFNIELAPNEYTLTFNTNNPDGASDISLARGSQTARYTYTWGDTQGDLPVPTKPGYTFLGWYTDPNGGVPITKDTQVYGQNIINDGGDVAYAHWQRNTYTVTFDPRGGTASASSRPVIYGTGNWNRGAVSATRTGYTLKGWQDGASNRIYDVNGDAVKGTYWTENGSAGSWKWLNNVTVYAIWEANPYTITFYKNNPNSTDDVSLLKTSQTVLYDSPWGALPTPTKPGYTFQGWYTSASGGSLVTQDTICKGHLNVYARWAPKQYTLYFDPNSPNSSNDVTMERTSQMAYYDSKWGNMPSASKPGYRFKGWWTDRTSGVQFTANTICSGYDIINANGDTAYAHWEPIEYTIEFKPNREHGPGEVSGSMGSIRLKYDQFVALPKNAFAKTTLVPSEDESGENVIKQSSFKGWSADPAAINPSYMDEARVMNLTTADSGVITFYAIWDDAPKFTLAAYPDRYFTLEEAQNGVITEDELLKTVVAYDREDVLLPHKNSSQVAATDDNGVTVVGYDPDEFLNLTDDGSVLVRYQVKDTSGHTSYVNIMVYVSRNGQMPDQEVSYYRSISSLYSNNPSLEGGLSDNSQWRGGAHKDALDQALGGTAKSYDLRFSKSQLNQIRDYVDAHGFGNSEEANALSEFWNMFR